MKLFSAGQLLNNLAAGGTRIFAVWVIDVYLSSMLHSRFYSYPTFSYHFFSSFLCSKSFFSCTWPRAARDFLQQHVLWVVYKQMKLCITLFLHRTRLQTSGGESGIL
jgi:hypothetical protein